jgi:hypothetical protein
MPVSPSCITVYVTITGSAFSQTLPVNGQNDTDHSPAAASNAYTKMAGNKGSGTNTFWKKRDGTTPEFRIGIEGGVSFFLLLSEILLNGNNRSRPEKYQ